MATPKVQYRMAELREDEPGSGFSGHASHFWSIDSYLTAVKPGAFKKTITERGAKVPVLYQHAPDWPIGRLSNLHEDPRGLYFDAVISEGTSHGRDAMALLRDGVPLGMSFGFQTVKSRTATEDDPLDFSQIDDVYGPVKLEDVQIIEEIKLWEVSLVTFPANESATISSIRAVAEADALTSLTQSIKSGTLGNDQRALVADLVAAFINAEPEPVKTTPLPAENARRRTIDIALAMATVSDLARE